MSLNKSKSLRTAEKYALQGRIPAAIDEYRKVVDADPSDLTTINTLGDLYVRAGKIQDAIINFSRIAESYRESGFTLKAIAMLKKISKLDPTNVDTSMKLANLYSQQGLLVEARQQYLQVADSYARAGQTRKALEAYQKIADLDPSNTAVRMKLGEIYSREAMLDQAHESFVLAGAEFMRKGEAEQALSANLKALTVNPESRQALTAIAAIYTQLGQIDRAINILCDAFERNPGDVELLTILGRTYLSAGMMDDAERTFLSLVELDRNRYHYLLEVGRRFLQMNDLDRAAEQIDGCLEVLIAKREEDKAIDFLRRVLDRDMNHIGALKRLGQIFLRIREDHNLIATLNSLVEAAMRKGDDNETIAALKELARLEPDEPIHLQRLYNLGVRDISEPDSPDIVRATGPLDYESAAFDDAFVIRQISEAEILAGHGQVEHAITILKEILHHAPENVQVHLKLKDIYLRAGILDKAAAECFELARIHEARGEAARAGDYFAEIQQISPLFVPPTTSAVDSQAGGWAVEGVDHVSLGDALGLNDPDRVGEAAGFEVREATGGLDLSRYRTGTLTDHGGFVTVPEDAPGSPADLNFDGQSNPAGTQSFRYSDTLIGGPNDSPNNTGPVAELVFSATGNMPSDTMTRVLRDELEGIDFYIAQGYVEIARDTLDRLAEEHGLHPEIMARYTRLGVSIASAEAAEATPQEAEGEAEITSEVAEFNVAEFNQAEPSFESLVSGAMTGVAPSDEYTGEIVRFGEVSNGEVAASDNKLTVTVPSAPLDSNLLNSMPFLIQKESGPLDPDLIVRLNTSELLNNTAFDMGRPPSGALTPALKDSFGTGELVESIVSEIDASFDSVQQPKDFTVAVSDVSILDLAKSDEPVGIEPETTEATEVTETTETIVEAAPPAQPGEFVILGEMPLAEENKSPWGDVEETPWIKAAHEIASEHNSLETQEMLDELKEDTSGLPMLLDYETHYSLGLAYKDMDLLDEAIEQFQMAFKMARVEDQDCDYIQCCHMLGVCFIRKQMPKVAIMWFQRALKIPNRSEDEYQALRFEIGSCYEEMGELDKALDVFMEVYGVDVNYRQVGEKVKQLQAAKGA